MTYNLSSEERDASEIVLKVILKQNDRIVDALANNIKVFKPGVKIHYSQVQMVALLPD